MKDVVGQLEEKPPSLLIMLNHPDVVFVGAEGVHEGLREDSFFRFGCRSFVRGVVCASESTCKTGYGNPSCRRGWHDNLAIAWPYRDR